MSISSNITTISVSYNARIRASERSDLMQELLNQIVSTLEANGGEMPYTELLDTIEYPQRSLLPKVKEYAKAQGIFIGQVAWNAEAGSITHTVRLLNQPQAESE